MVKYSNRESISKSFKVLSIRTFLIASSVKARFHWDSEAAQSQHKSHDARNTVSLTPFLIPIRIVFLIL